jgi:two-component system CheB/CheR fusion protein
LTRELSHRVKNTFAVVQALAKQTAYSASSVEQFSDAFLARLHGMARAHSLVLNSRSSDLEALVLQTMEAHRVNSPDRIEIDGVPVSLSTRQVLGLGLALHELATNAAKYGALATRSGIVRVAWQIQTTQKERQLRLQWRERQGPRVDPPAHSGFGTQLIERVCAYELDGTVEQDYAPEGLTAVISFPLDGEL